MNPRLLYLHQYFRFPDQSGGTRSYDLSKKFVQNGIEVIIITSSSGFRNTSFKKRWTYIEREGIKVWILKNKYDSGMAVWRRIFSFIRFAWFTTIKTLKIKADLVLATSTPFTVAIPAIIKKWKSNTPYIFEVRDVWPEGPIQQGFIKNKFLIKALRRSEKLVYENAAYVVPLSIGMKKCIHTRVEVKQIEVIPNISEIERFQRNTNKADVTGIEFNQKKTVLYAGTCGVVNNIIYVAEMAKNILLLDPAIQFLIIGRGKQKNRIVEYCIDNKILNKNIFFLNSVPKDNLPHIYSQVTIGSSFVWDYKILWDNSANKFFDTLAAGKPVLINHLGWQAELIKEYNCGYILPPKPNMEDYRAFVEYINNESLIHQQGVNALNVANTQFSLDIAVNKYLNIINNCLPSRQPSFIHE